MRHRSQGFLLIDVLFGLSIVGLLLLVLSMAAGQQRRAAQQLGHQRAALTAAEQALTALQTRVALPDGVEVAPANAGAVPAGYRWVVVSASRDGAHASIVGLVPEVQP